MNNEDQIMREKLEAKFDELFADLDAELPEVEEGMNTIMLNDEQGNEVEFEILDLVEYNGEEYVILLPVESGEDADEVVILKFEGSDNDDEQESYVSVDDEKLLMTIFNIFKEKFQDEFNFVD